MQNRKRETDVQSRLLDSVREGKGGMFQENSIKTCILKKKKKEKKINMYTIKGETDHQPRLDA